MWGASSMLPEYSEYIGNIKEMEGASYMLPEYSEYIRKIKEMEEASSMLPEYSEYIGNSSMLPEYSEYIGNIKEIEGASSMLPEYSEYTGNIKEMQGASSLPEYSEVASSNDSVSRAICMETQLKKKLEEVDSEIVELKHKCIYRVPDKFRNVNPKAYTPWVVSIGPFHNPLCSDGGDNLKLMEKRKLIYLEKFLNRNQKLSMRDLFIELIKKEKQIRGYYAEPIRYISHDFLMMILVDACFIIEHFLRVYTGLDITERNALSKTLLSEDIYNDLKLFENQVPYFVLEDIFNSAHPGMTVEFPYKDKDRNFYGVGSITDVESLSFIAITYHYFETDNHYKIDHSKIGHPKHFTHLLRKFWNPNSIPPESLTSQCREKVIPSASQLSEVGMIFKVSSGQGLLDIKYDDRKGVLELSHMFIKDRTEIELRNMLALEQCYNLYSPNFTQYLFILDCLINTADDVNILIDNKIITNRLGDAEAVAKMFNSLCSNASMPRMSKEYCSMLGNLNKFHEDPRNKHKAIFYREYFNTPWKKASTSAAVILLLLTLIQTICSVISLS